MENNPIHSSPSRIRALAIDDNQDFLEILSLFLRSKGVQVATENGGLPGLRRYLAAPESFDVVLLDIQMPDMDGNEVAQRILKSAPQGLKKVAIIGMSGHANELDDELFSLFLRKPFPYETLLSAISRVLSPQHGAESLGGGGRLV